MASRPNPTARPSISKPSGPPIEAHSTTLISASASILGSHPIRLGAHVIIQPRSKLSSAAGSIDIGEGCIINERATIGISGQNSPQLESDANLSPAIRLGQGVLIECGATLEAASIGAFTIVETGATIGRGAVVGKNCKICARVQVAEGDFIGDNVVVFGSGWGERRVENRNGPLIGKREAWMKGQGEILRKVWTGK